MFRNVGIYKWDAGELPKRKHTIFWTRRKLEIKNTEFLFISIYKPECKSNINLHVYVRPDPALAYIEFYGVFGYSFCLFLLRFISYYIPLCKYRNMKCKSHTTIIYYYYVECQINDNMFRPFLILIRKYHIVSPIMYILSTFHEVVFLHRYS